MVSPEDASASRLDAARTRKFHHPYEPYEIQTQFMSALYDCIEQGKVGIFESPTAGTGKSLSLICGSLTWLRDHKRITFEEGLAVDAVDDDEPDWMLEHARQEKRRAALHQRQQLEERIARVRARERKLKERHSTGEPHRKRQKISTAEAEVEDDEARFMLDDYESEDEQAKKVKSTGGSDRGFSAETVALMKKLGMPVDRKSDDEEIEEPDELKIFYCSRTHSQLQQFASELRRVKMPPAISAEPPDKTNSSCEVSKELEEDFKHLTLGSRKNLCINPKVSRLGSTALINEKCLDLQKPGTAQDHKCTFLPTKETEPLVHDFRDHALAEIRDIEELGAVGKQLGVCPYYASRAAVKPSEIVTLPYPLLLQKSAREALDISMKDHIVIIDEAHNLMDSIIGIYSVSISLAQLQTSRAQLTMYLQKFRNRLKGKNRVYVAQTVRLMDSLIAYLQGPAAQAKEAEGVVKFGDLMAGKGVDQINLYKLLRYLQESKLARKVDGYIVHAEEQQANNSSHKDIRKQPKSHMPVLNHVQSFFASLLNPSAEGRFFYAKNDDSLGMCLKYMLLDPTHHFREIVEDARAVVLAGGTMSPMSDYEQHLFPYLPASRITTLSCGHVIPPSNLLAWPVTRGPSGSAFDFTFEKRNSPALMADLGLAILEFAKTIPDGVVVFFPSYAYLDQCVAAWKRAAAPASATAKKDSLFDAIQAVKPVFHEAKSQQQQSRPSVTSKDQQPSSTTESVLTSYTHAVNTGAGRGALLLAVVGGSLSEGINFSDALGRGVAVVGLPFPNPHSAEWRAKMAYISQKTASSKGGDAAAGKAAAREFYENACMRAVNQCVGRAIRHRGDYAAILLLDGRYDGERIRKKLPGWIRGSLREGRGAKEVMSGVRGFFEAKK
ncbi:helicase C-terminal domain-containing protein [Phyllosticta capitalensis]|uniref:ATP-dependent DNA helicase CHL1 n=1 Tax=Phyllosticta capitalensis TaxID=121624 RepID=A0ABR1YEC3_9PEZI